MLPRIFIVALALGLFAGVANAVPVPVGSLAGMTPTRTDSAGAIASSQYNDNAVDGDAFISSNADITLAFEMTILDLTPAGNRSLFEFGGGNGTGFSLLHRSTGDFTLQVEQGTNQLGGAGVLEFDLPANLLNKQIAVVASLDTDATASTLNLFIDNVLVATATGAPITDWAGTDGGGFFFGTNAVLAANFSQQDFDSPLASEATADSDLRYFEGAFAIAIPEPATAALGLMGVVGLLVRRRTV